MTCWRRCSSDCRPIRSGRRHHGPLGLRPGWSAANVAAIGAELGATTRFVGQVGDDQIGRTLVDDMAHRGVQCQVEHRGGTGVVVTMIGEGGRSRMIDRGAARRLPRIDTRVLDDATQLYVAASAFTEDPLAGAIDQLLGETTDRRLPVTIGGPTLAELASIGAPAFLALCRTLRPAHVILDREEHSALGVRPREGLDGASVTVVTNGRRPTLVITAEDDRAVEVPPRDAPRDRTGVGDGFIAGFLQARGRGADPVAATHAGHRAAGRVLASLGPTVGVDP
ncbi:MAG: PfkB family carbohydrate kinase [Acidimicrobiales bacterium]